MANNNTHPYLSASEKRVYAFWSEYNNAPTKEQDNLSRTKFGNRLERRASSAVIMVNNSEASEITSVNATTIDGVPYTPDSVSFI